MPWNWKGFGAYHPHELDDMAESWLNSDHKIRYVVLSLLSTVFFYMKQKNIYDLHKKELEAALRNFDPDHELLDSPHNFYDE